MNRPTKQPQRAKIKPWQAPNRFMELLRLFTRSIKQLKHDEYQCIRIETRQRVH